MRSLADIMMTSQIYEVMITIFELVKLWLEALLAWIGYHFISSHEIWLVKLWLEACLVCIYRHLPSSAYNFAVQTITEFNFSMNLMLFLSLPRSLTVPCFLPISRLETVSVLSLNAWFQLQNVFLMLGNIVEAAFKRCRWLYYTVYNS